jgi:hypothetical protein
MSFFDNQIQTIQKQISETEDEEELASLKENLNCIYKIIKKSSVDLPTVESISSSSSGKTVRKL